MPLPTTGTEGEFWIALASIPNLGNDGIRRLLKIFGSPKAVLAANEAALIGEVGAARAKAILSHRVDGESERVIGATLKWLEAPSNHLITLADDDYPAPLLEIADPPVVLYGRGRRDLLASTCLAVVGSRNATPVGMQNAEQFAKTISQQGITIVSGLALGIDAGAHRGGLLGRASTIAIVGTGMDLVYPAQNKALAQQIANEGLVLSEFDLGTPPLPRNFPRRNRIISGLSQGVLVVEAALESGSLITARQALEQGRDVFAIPGSIHSPLSKGAHTLIKQGAKLVDDAQDILSDLGWGMATARAKPVAQKSDMPHHPLLEAIGFDPVSTDELCMRTGRGAHELASALTELEIAGQVVQLPGGKYQRLA